MGVGEVVSAQFSLAIRQNLMGCSQVRKLELLLVGSNSDTDSFSVARMNSLLLCENLLFFIKLYVGLHCLGFVKCSGKTGNMISTF